MHMSPCRILGPRAILLVKLSDTLWFLSVFQAEPEVFTCEVLMINECVYEHTISDIISESFFILK